MNVLPALQLPQAPVQQQPIEARPVNSVIPDPARLKDWQRKCMTARQCILLEVERRMKEQGISFNVAARTLLNEANGGALPDHIRSMLDTANHRKGKSRTLSTSTLYRWSVIKKEQGIGGLAPEDTERPLTVPAWLPEFLSFYRISSKPSILQALEMMAAERLRNGARIEDMPAYMTVTRALKKMSNVDVQRGRRTGSDLKAIRGYCIRDKSIYEPLDIVVADGHSFKAKVSHPVHGKPFNPEVEGVIDIATRVCLGWSAGLAESAMIVADAIRHAVTVNENKPLGGCFAIFYCDSGAGNKAKIISDDVTGILARIGASFEKGMPGNPQGRGVIERMQGSLWVRAAKELPTFTGKGMDSLAYRKTMKIVEKDIKEKGTSEGLISWPQFLEFCQRTIDAYNNRPHSALPKITDIVTTQRRHMTPVEMWNAFATQGWKPTLLDEVEIKDLFKPQVQVQTRRAMVTLFGNTYFNTELEHYHGETVYVNYDIHDADVVWVRDRQQRLICEAVFEGNKRHYFPISAVEKARMDRAKNRLRLKEQQVEEIKLEAMGVTEIEEHIPDEAVKASDTPHILEKEDAPATPDERPFFGGDHAARYEWHLKNGFKTEEDLRFKVEFEQSDSYQVLKQYWQ